MNKITIEVDRLDDVSDGYHTIGDLYRHRHALFVALLRANKGRSFKTMKDHLSVSYSAWFIAGINTPEGQITYHMPESYWDELEDIPEVESNKDFDGHKSSDVLHRLLVLQPERE
jgi:hypothetical protein